MNTTRRATNTADVTQSRLHGGVSGATSAIETEVENNKGGRLDNASKIVPKKKNSRGPDATKELLHNICVFIHVSFVTIRCFKIEPLPAIILWHTYRVEGNRYTILGLVVA